MKLYYIHPLIKILFTIKDKNTLIIINNSKQFSYFLLIVYVSGVILPLINLTSRI